MDIQWRSRRDGRSRCTPLVSRVTRGAAATLAVTVVLCVTGTTRAAISYGNYSGTTVDYVNVTEDNQNLYGTPTITGDTLSFSPVEFEAQSSGAVPPQLVDGTLSFVLDAKGSNSIDAFQISEAGAYDLLGVGTSATQVSVAVVMSINVLEVNGVAASYAPFAVSQLLFTDNRAAGVDFATPWSATGTFDIANLALINRGITGDITKVAITINNKLLAQSEAGSTSFIDKKAINGFTLTVVPEPASLALLAAGAALVGYGRFGRRG